MPAIALDEPRAVRAPQQAGLYESHYLKATDPAGGRAVWLRHTVMKRPGEAPRTTVWLTWFDRAREAPLARRVTEDGPAADPGVGWSRGALGSFGPAGADGALEGVGWSLCWDAGAAPSVPYLPARRLYDRPVPRSNGVALHPDARVSGTLEVEGDEVALDAWPGMIGHNWGADHAAHWAWIHGAGLGPSRASWVDVALARIEVGGRLTPWLGAGAVLLDGGRRAVSLRGAALEIDGDRVRAQARVAGGARLRVDASLAPQATVAWDYDGPDGGRRDVRNCSVADATLVLEGRATTTVEVDGALAVEVGGPPTQETP